MSTATTAIKSFTPPIMGGLRQVSALEEEAWTGGKPKHDWSGLATKPVGLTPNQARPMSGGVKGYLYRQAGISTKFTKHGDITDFAHKISKEDGGCRY